MKKPHFYYDMTKETYNYVTNGVLLRESKKEKTILYYALCEAIYVVLNMELFMILSIQVIE